MLQLSHDLESRDETIAQLQSTVTKLASEQNTMSDHTEQARLVLQNKFQELEAQFSAEREQHGRLKIQKLERERELEGKIRDYTEALSQLQVKLETNRHELDNSDSRVRQLQLDVKSLNQELIDYKARATQVQRDSRKVLQSRAHSTSPDVAVSVDDVVKLRTDNEDLKREASKLQLLVEELRDTMTLQATKEASALEDITSRLAEQVSLAQDYAEKLKVQHLERDTLQTELDSLRRQLHEQASTSAQEAVAKDKEVARLVAEAKNREAGTTGLREAETRLKQLTESLLEKQTQLEHATTGSFA